MATSDNLHNDREKLRDEQRTMEGDLTLTKTRWQNAKDEKVKAAFTLHVLEKAEEELEHLAEEHRQLNLEEKVTYSE